MQQFSSDQCRNREEQSNLRRPLCSRTLFSEVLPTVGPNLSMFFVVGLFERIFATYHRTCWACLALIHPWLLHYLYLPITSIAMHGHGWDMLGYMSPMIVQGPIGRATSLPDSSDIRLTQWQGNIAMRWTSNGWMRMGGVHKITEETRILGWRWIGTV